MATNIYFFLLGIFSIAYFLFLLRILHGLKCIFRMEGTSAERKTVSVVIPFRNEVQNIRQNIESLCAQDYPHSLVQLIYVNDHSDDGSEKIIEDFVSTNSNIFLLHNTADEQGKKKAIRKGVEFAKGEIIIGTDADCIYEKTWLSTMVSQFTDNIGFVSGPVTFEAGKGFFNRFQEYEFAGLVLAGAGLIGSGVPVICNAANIAYRRALFHEIKGFDHKYEITGGDDELIMQKIYRTGKYAVTFLADSSAVVKTRPNETVKDFFLQRTRWASKGLFYNKKFVAFVLIPIFFFYLFYLLLPIIAIFKGIQFLWIFFIIFFLKSLLEYRIMRYAENFLIKHLSLWYFFLSEIVQPLYIVTASLNGSIGNFTWKKRRFKR